MCWGQNRVHDTLVRWDHSGSWVGWNCGRYSDGGHEHTCSDDHCLCLDLFVVCPQAEGALREIELGDGLGKDGSAVVDALLPEAVHQLVAQDGRGEACGQRKRRGGWRLRGGTGGGCGLNRRLWYTDVKWGWWWWHWLEVWGVGGVGAEV